MGSVTYGNIARNDFMYLVNTEIFTVDYLNPVSVSIQQVIEKLLKHVIDVELPKNEQVKNLLHTHKLRPLIICLRTHYPDIIDYIGDIGVVDSVYFDTRYPGDSYYNITPYELNKCVEALNKTVDWFYNSVNILTLFNLYIEVTGVDDSISRFPDSKESRDLLKTLTGFKMFKVNI